MNDMPGASVNGSGPVQDNVPPVDPANKLLSHSPHAVHYGLVRTPQGMRVVQTIRTPSTTVSVFLEKAEAIAWFQMGLDIANSVSDLDVPVTPRLIIPGQ